MTVVGSKSAVQVVVQENLRGSLDQLARESNCHKARLLNRPVRLVGDTFQQQRLGVHLAFTYATAFAIASRPC